MGLNFPSRDLAHEIGDRLDKLAIEYLRGRRDDQTRCEIVELRHRLSECNDQVRPQLCDCPVTRGDLAARVRAYMACFDHQLRPCMSHIQEIRDSAAAAKGLAKLSRGAISISRESIDQANGQLRRDLDVFPVILQDRRISH